MTTRRRSSNKFAVIDLFAGPGGLGEGFTSLKVKDEHPFDIVLSAEKDPMAQQTLELRAFVRKFRAEGIPREYWDFLCRRISREQLFAAYTRESAAARAESKQFELGGSNRRVLELRLDDLRLDRDRTIVIGGPPCQAYSVVGRSRSSAKKDWTLETDSRSHLYREYLHVLAHVEPVAFVMENVRGLLSARFGDASVFNSIRSDLKDPRKAISRKLGGRRYRLLPLGGATSTTLDVFNLPAPEDFLLKAEEHGVPQARHRVIIVGIAEDAYSEATTLPRLATVRRRSTVRSAIDDLPELRSGLSKGLDGDNAWHRAIAQALESRWIQDCEPEIRRVIKSAVERAGSMGLARGGDCLRRKGRRTPTVNHSTRGHIPADLHRYLFAASYAEVTGTSPTLKDFPRTLLPKHANAQSNASKAMFNDRFRVQCWDAPATTVVSHISKDGHYYIHPDPAQCRSLTVREAARLQTFPDDYYFCGPRTAQYQQVGNAVPIRLAGLIAESLTALLGS